MDPGANGIARGNGNNSCQPRLRCGQELLDLHPEVQLRHQYLQYDSLVDDSAQLHAFEQDGNSESHDNNG
jgi:hypothetical protein